MQKDTTFLLIKNLKDPASLEIKRKIQQLADMDTNLLIFGETGVGKDFWVHYMHAVGSRQGLVNLNCGDVPENLLESEWFGYKKGAFTGANHDYQGKWAQADEGILFLNQIDLLSLNLQSKLLRIIERKQYFPLGSNREVDVKARFVFSTDHDIEQKVRQGRFRQDLYYRISSYSIEVPPLRRRKKDIVPLAKFFADRHHVRFALGKEALGTLEDYPWRGNIREIENFITNVSIVKKELEDDDVYDLLKDSEDFLAATGAKEMSLAELENRYIQYLLKKYKRKTLVAKILKISRKSLYNKLNREL